LAAGQHFDQITTQPGVIWDTSQLYTSGIVTLTSVPEPPAIALAGVGVVGLVAFRRGDVGAYF
jgi:hypothetical protein